MYMLRRLLVPLLGMLILAGWHSVLDISLVHAQAQPGADPPILELLEGIGTGGEPDKLAIDCAGRQCRREHTLLYTDRQNNRVRFIDLNSNSVAEESIGFGYFGFEDRWLVFDRQRRIAYVIAKRDGEDTFDPAPWTEIFVYAIGDKDVKERISLNREYNEGKAQPPDRHVAIDGIAYKQASDDSGSAKLIVANTISGNIDSITFDRSGTRKQNIGRASYRDPLPCATEQFCSWKINEGNSLALEPAYQQPGGPAIGVADLLYIADDNGSFVPDVYLIGNNDVSPLMNPYGRVQTTSAFLCSIGNKGITVANGVDQFIAASGCQSFEEGSIGIFSTHDQRLLKSVVLQYADTNFAYADWYDPNRLFVVTQDIFGEYDAGQTLTLNLIYQGEIVATLPIGIGGDQEVRDMVFDPYTRRLYIAMGSGIAVVQVNYGSAPALGQTTRTFFLIDPLQSGTYTVDDRSAALTFPAGFHRETVAVTYAEDGAEVTGAATALKTVRTFDVTATLEDGETPVSSFDGEYTIQINPSERELGTVKPGSMDLYWWDGAQWVQQASNVSGGFGDTPYSVSGTTQQTGRFSIQAQSELTFLPTVIR